MRGERGAAGATVLALVLAGVFVLAGMACRRSAEAPSAPARSRTDARVDGGPRPDASRREAAAPHAAAGATDDRDDEAAAAVRLDDLICKRPRCCVTRAMPAGMHRDGTRYTVVRVDLHPGRRRCGVPQTGDQPDAVDPAARKANEGGDLDETQCER